MTINGTYFTKSEVERLARVLHALHAAGIDTYGISEDMLRYQIQQGQSVDAIVGIVCNKPVRCTPDELARNDALWPAAKVTH